MNSITNILIIGAGNIGSRHLQGVLNSKYKLIITIVDPSEDSLHLSKLRSKEIQLGNSETYINYQKEITNNHYYDIVIISTNADIRAEVTRKLLSQCKIKYIIFEKILFQKENHFKIISKLLETKNILAWVNCPRRTYSFYQKIKKTLDKSEEIEMSVCGSSWNMASNSIHFIDLFSYLVNNANVKIIKTMFSNNIFKSKKNEKFYEVNGKIELEIGAYKCKIICEENKNPFLSVKIKNGQIEHFVNESKGIYNMYINGFMKEKEYIDFPMQSNETGKLIDSLISSNNCELTPYHESWKHHDPLIHSMKEHISKTLKGNLDKCPIT